MSIFDEDKLIDDDFLKWLGFQYVVTNNSHINYRFHNGYIRRYYCRYRDHGHEPISVISAVDVHYDINNYNLTIYEPYQEKSYKVYNQDDFLTALYKHELIYFKIK